MKQFLQIALGILSAIGGFVDIGDLVFNTQAGATFGFQLLWVVVIGVIYFALGCTSLAATLGITVSCNVAGAYAILKALFMIASGN